MSYRKVFNNPYPEGWVDLPNEDTSISAAALQAHTDAIEKMDSYLEKIGKAEDAGYIQMNMFNMSTVYIGKKLGDEGELVDDPGSMTTDFIEIDDKVQYMLSALNDSECLVKVHAYNSDFEWMMLCAMQTFYDNVVFPFAVVNGAKYIKVSLSKDAKEVVLEDGYITHPYLPSNKELAAELSEQKESLIQYEQSGFLSNNLVYPQLVDYSGNSLGSSYSNNGITFSIESDGAIRIKGTSSANVTACRVKLAEVVNSQYALSINAEGTLPRQNTTYARLGTNDGNYSDRTILLTESSGSVTEVPTRNYSQIQLRISGGETVDFKVYISCVYGNTPHSYTPYAISNQGLTQIVEDAQTYKYLGLNSKNVWKQGNIESDGSITITSLTRIYTDNYIEVEPNSTIYLDLPSNMQYGLACYNANKGWIGFSGGWRSDDKPTIPSNTYFVRISLKYTDNSTITTNKAIRVDTVPSNSELKQSLNQLSTVQSGAVTNLSAIASTYRMRLKKCGNIVTINFYFGLNAISDNLTQWYPLFQLPSGFYNTDNHIDFILNDFDKNSYQAMVSSTGQMQFVPRASITQGRLCVVNLTYILG